MGINKLTREDILLMERLLGSEFARLNEIDDFLEKKKVLKLLNTLRASRLINR